MDRYLRPEKFDADPNSSSSSSSWKHWYRTFQNFLQAIEEHSPNKLDTLINYVAPSVYTNISECSSYEEAIEVLTQLYIKPKNEIFARHLLATRRQRADESLDEFLLALKQLSVDCNFRSVSAEQYKDESVRDAYITGLQSNFIRQRLLENKTLDIITAHDQARALDLAQKNSESYIQSGHLACAASNTHCATTIDQNLSQSTCNSYVNTTTNQKSQQNNERFHYDKEARAVGTQKCFFCGNKRHSRQICPARNASCQRCFKKGHFAKVCRANISAATVSSQNNTNDEQLSLHHDNFHSTSQFSLAAVTAASSEVLSQTKINVLVNGHCLRAQIDTASTDSYINKTVFQRLRLPYFPESSEVVLAENTQSTQIDGFCLVQLLIKDRSYQNVRLAVFPNLCADILLGNDFLSRHNKVSVLFGGKEPALSICGLSALRITAPPLFSNLSGNCRPIATKSRSRSLTDRQFIQKEIRHLLAEGIIEQSNSPWRAQVVVVDDGRHKKRLVIDYSQTINRYTELDAYPLPRIDELANIAAQYKYFSTIDLQSAYHQVAISEGDKLFTAFEAEGNLYQFKRLPFGVTNGVSCFQRVMDVFISRKQLKDTFPYLDDLLIGGRTKEEHDFNLKRFLDAAKQYRLTINNEKSKFSQTAISWLGYRITHNELRPDPERLKPLENLPLPQDAKSLKRVVGLFSYYSRWIRNFSDKINPLVHNIVFPLSVEAQESFHILKRDIHSAVIHSISEKEKFVVETDASDFAVAATLNQSGRPVAFFSRTLNPSEKRHSAVEKEAYAVVEALRKWRHYLIGHRFTLVTDQKSVSFMFDSKQASKIKNDKILRWRIELACYDFDILYRPGYLNAPADTFSRIVCSALTSNKLPDLHNDLCHPGVTRMLHFVRSKNLPYSVEEVRKVTSNCRVCAECKPRFHSSSVSHLIKATSPFERLNIDFKGPIPSSTNNKYMLTVIDEYSRFPFVYPCSDVSAVSVIKSLSGLFTVFGTPLYIHSDRGASFMSSEVKTFLGRLGIATSRTSQYNPQGNSQCERYNGVIWKTISLALRERNLNVSKWEQVLQEALHSIRSLLCTTTNTTPHERLFTHPRRSQTGQSLPSWLLTPGPVLVKRHVRRSKYDPYVDEAELLEVNPQYAHIRLDNGNETTVPLRDLAPCGEGFCKDDYLNNSNTTDNSNPLLKDIPVPSSLEETSDGREDNSRFHEENTELQPTSIVIPQEEQPDPRRSTRIRYPVNRLNL